MNSSKHLVQTIQPISFQLDRLGVRVTSPQLRVGIRASEQVVRLLMKARMPLLVDQPLVDIGLDETAWDMALNGLLNLGFLVDVSDGSDPFENQPLPWRDWGPEAWAFHCRTRNVRYIEKEQEVLEYKNQLTNLQSPPSFAPSITEEPILLLPRHRVTSNRFFDDVLFSRRTHRRFSNKPISINRFATFLHDCFGPQRFVNCGDLGVMQLRTSASAGGRHETDAYVIVMNVQDVANGIYRYDGLRHGLVHVSSNAARHTWEDLTYTQGFFGESGFAVVLVSITERMAWKYRSPRAYRFALQNVGHVAQVASMVAESLGLGAAITGAFRDDEVEDILHLEIPKNFASFVLVIGYPATPSDADHGNEYSPSMPWLP